MPRAVLSRALVVALLSIEAFVAVRFTQARSTPALETNASQSTEVASAAPTAVAHSATLPPMAAASNEQDKPAALRVLLVGNSYTLHHSLHQLLQRVAASVDAGPRVSVDAVAHGGYSLRQHLRHGEAMQRIRSGRYTHVVLQGHSLSAIDHPDELAEDAERFKQAIDASASRTVFYATWARSPEVSLYRTHRSVHSFAEMSTRVSSTYSTISQRLGAVLAPVGSAFERALIHHPKLTLWSSDGSHPTLAGSYMAACVLYGAITGADPSLTSFVPAGMRENDAALIRQVASESLTALQPAALMLRAAQSAQLFAPM